MKIKLDSNNDLPLNTTIGDYNVTIVGREIFIKITNFVHKFSYRNVSINYRRERKKYIICQTKSFYILLTILLFTIALLIVLSIYWYLIKYKAKRKHLSPFYITNNRLKKVLY